MASHKSPSPDTPDKRFDQENRDIQNRILTIPGARGDLDILARAGADTAKVLQLLSYAASYRDWWRAPMRRKKRELESLADQIDSVAKHCDRVSLDHLSYLTFWTAIMGLPTLGRKLPDPKELAPRFIWALMRFYAKNCRDRAREFGGLLRKQSPLLRRQMIDCLLLEVWRGTGSHHDRELSRLLTDSFEAVGSKRQKSQSNYIFEQSSSWAELYTPYLRQLHNLGEKTGSDIAIAGSLVALKYLTECGHLYSET